MKRVKAACICQTLHFMLKDGVSQEYAAKLVQDEVAAYKESLKRSATKHRILEEDLQSDGSVIFKLIKQYNQSPVGDYLD